jgi:predicted PurR-regulated permease PerM
VSKATGRGYEITGAAAAPNKESTMGFPDHRTLNVVLTTLLVACGCVLVYRAWPIILVFVLAIFFAYLINPVVQLLERHSLFFRNLRGPAVLEAYLAFLILSAIVGYGLAPGVAKSTAKLLDDVPTLLDGLSSGEIVTDLGGKYGWTEKQELRLKSFLLRHKDSVQDLVKIADRYVSHAAELFGGLLLIPVLAIFFLRDGEHIADTLTRMVFREDSQKTVRALTAELHTMLTRYIRAQAILCGLSFAFYSTVMLVLSFPHAVALAALGGALEFIPAAGWMTTAALTIGVGAANHAHWLWMIVLLIIWRVTQNYFTSPRIMGRQLELHPLAAIFAVLVGAKTGGMVGIYLAVPVTAALRVVWRTYAVPKRSAGHTDHPTKSTESAGLAQAAAD